MPAAPTKDSNYTYNQVIVLMLDGLNTLDRGNGNGSTTNTSVDKRMYETSALGTVFNTIGTQLSNLRIAK